MPNRLVQETSPYLQQHADNPVDWYPWGEQALERSRAEDKPILLSIGYSACHWCHVMAHESFEDTDVARVMNELFVNIKVDREERPDLDQVYQLAHALLTRRPGGWPLTMVLTPQGDPFFAGTYFPNEGRYGLPAFPELLQRVARAYREQGPAIAEQSGKLRDVLESLAPAPGSKLPESAPAAALKGLKAAFDAEHGGFGGAPKFPHPTELEFSLRMFGTTGDREALHMVEKTLCEMARGGIHDQLGGGFCRYSVDAQWTIPHFEKMLYDNGPLLGLYADLARTGVRDAEVVARNIVGWLTREMRADDGAFYSSLDADSEGEEGKFYVWTRGEVQALLTAEEYAVAAPHFGLDGPPNFEHQAWHLRVVRSVEDIAEEQGLSLPDVQTRLMGATTALFRARSGRTRPGLDDKILTSWNALAIAGLARAARAMQQPRWGELACTAADSIRRTQWRDGRLLATRKGARAHLNAYLDDHAFLLMALLELMQTRFRIEDYAFARLLADALLARFEDQPGGGFWFTSHDHEKLLVRQKPGPDNATPSGNGVAAHALLILGHLCGDTRYLDAARRTLRAFAGSLAQSAGGHSSLLGALQEIVAPPTTVVIAGDEDDGAAWQRSIEATYRPTTRVFHLARAAAPGEIAKGAPPERGARAWVCRGTTCLPPVDTERDLLALLASPS